MRLHRATASCFTSLPVKLRRWIRLLSTKDSTSCTAKRLASTGRPTPGFYRSDIYSKSSLQLYNVHFVDCKIDDSSCDDSSSSDDSSSDDIRVQFIYSSAICVGCKDMNTYVIGSQLFENLKIKTVGGHKDCIVGCYFEQDCLDVSFLEFFPGNFANVVVNYSSSNKGWGEQGYPWGKI